MKRSGRKMMKRGRKEKSIEELFPHKGSKREEEERGTGRRKK